MKKIGYALLIIFSILIGLFLWFGTCASLYVYSPNYLIKNHSDFGIMSLAELVHKTGSCKARNYDSFLIYVLKVDLREQPVCEKCLDSFGRLANASLNKKYPGKNIPFMRESQHDLFLNFVDEEPNRKPESFLGIETLNTDLSMHDKEYEEMKSLWKRTKRNGEISPEVEIIKLYAHRTNEESILRWEEIIKTSKKEVTQ